MGRDVRNFLLIKSAIDNSQQINFEQIFASNTIKQDCLNFLALGEYDGVCVYKIHEIESATTSSGRLLTAILNENNAISSVYDGTIFVHPLYAMLSYETSTQEKEIIDFWSNFNSNFLFITTIHLKGIEINSDTILKAKNKICQEITDNSANYTFLIYDTLDLSDFIIVWKSNEINPVLNKLKELYFNTNLQIGYIKTTCSLNYSNILADESEYFQYRNKISENDMINITTVASGGNLHAIHDNEVVPSTENFFVLGNQDFTTIHREMQTKVMFDMFRSIVKKSVPNEDAHSIVRAITKIGINCELKRITTKSTNGKLFNICQKLHTRLKCIQNNISDIENFEWVNVSLELTNLMSIMSCSDIYDSLCILLVESVDFYCSWLEFIISKSHDNEDLQKRLYKEEEYIQSFVRAWKQLIDNVVHSDGITVQVPGYSLSSYNIYNTIIEYSSAYFKKLSHLLSSFDDVDNNGESQLTFIISPKLCRRIKTTEIFYFKQDKDSLLSLEIPIPAMLNPFLLLTSMTHEAAHYCGEEARLKLLREDIFIKCISEIICSSLDMREKPIFEAITKEITALIKSYCRDCSKKLYLKDLEHKLNHAVNAILGDDVFLSDLLQKSSRFTSNEDKYDDLIEKYIDDINNLQYGSNNINTHILSISSFLKECYADIVMIGLLELSLFEYVSILYPEFLRANLINNKPSNEYRFLLQRIFMVAKTCNLLNLDCLNELVDNADIETQQIHSILKDLIEFNNRYDLFYNSKEKSFEFVEGCYSFDIMFLIISYLQKCLNKLKDGISKYENVYTDLKNIYNILVVNDDFFSSRFQNVISDYRSEVMHKYTESGSAKSRCSFE